MRLAGRDIPAFNAVSVRAVYPGGDLLVEMTLPQVPDDSRFANTALYARVAADGTLEKVLARVHRPPEEVRVLWTPESRLAFGTPWVLQPSVAEKQDSLGLKAWGSFAEEAGVPDVDRFHECRTEPHYFPRIGRGIELGNRAGVTSTPTLVVNGWKLPRPPSSTDELREIVRTVLRGEAPATGDTISVAGPDWQWEGDDSIIPSGSSGGSR